MLLTVLGAERREGGGYCITMLIFQNEGSLFHKSGGPQETVHLYHSQEARLEFPVLAFPY